MVIITGTIAYDYIMNFPGKYSDHILPDQLYSINLSFIVDKFERRRGGTAGNVSYALGLLGTKHILLSCAGKDFSEYKKAFQKLGISLKHVAIDQSSYTATGFAMTDKTNNQIWGYFYGAAKNNPKLSVTKVAKTQDLVLIGPAGAVGSMSLLKQCVAKQIPYFFDPGFILTQISNDELIKGVTHAQYIAGNDYEIKVIKSRVKNFEKLAKDKVIITTFGEKGAEISDHGKKFIIKAVKAKKVVDPTGAGDAWRAGFLAGLERGYNLQTAGQMGAVAAAYAVEVYGTQEYYYTKKEFKNRYRQSYGSSIEL